MKTKEQTSKTRFRKRIVAMAASALLVAASVATALPAQAAENVPPATNLTWSFNKYLVMDKDANVPNVTFEFEIKAGEAVPADGNKPAIYAGNDANRVAGESPSVGSVVFTPDDSTTSGKPDDAEPGTPTAGFKYATKPVTVNFSNVKFNAPGIYRYIITEKKGSTTGIAYDETPRTLDVFVEYTDPSAGGQLKVTDYILYKDVNAGTKDDGFTNTYATKDLTLEKQVTGNQGDRNKYFEFTVAITGAAPGTVYTVDLAGAEGTPTVDGQLKTNADTLTAEDGTATATYYLKDDQFIVVQGLTSATNYTIAEKDYSSTDGYTTSYTLDGSGPNSSLTTGQQTMSTNAHKVIFTNDKQGTVPTGILLETAPYLVLGVVVLAGLTVLFMTRRRRVR